MSFNIPDPGERPRRPTFTPGRRSRALLPTLAILAALIIGFLIFVGFWTDLLWFRAVGYRSVFTTQLRARLGLFVVFGLIMAIAVAVNIYIAHRFRPSFRGMSPEQQSLDRYRMAIEPYRRLLLIGVAVLLGLFAGSSAMGQWRTWMQWRNSTPFGQDDPQFGRDISFYAFSYPWWRFLLGFSFAVVVLSLLAAAAVHYLYGGLRVQTPGSKASSAAQAHLSVLIGVFILLKAAAYWLDRYGLAIKPDEFFGSWTGLRYKDVNAVLPAKTILFIIAIICAGLFFATVIFRTWMLPGVGFGLLVLSAILIGGVYPALVQQFQVRPDEAQKEAPYIQRNIEATRAAYSLTGVEPTGYEATTTASAGQLREDAGTTASIRLLDPGVVSPTFQQLQQIRSFYSFPDSLDVDRYEIDGQVQDSVVAVRELNPEGIPERNWINEHLRYTHGFGFVAALGNTREENGTPTYVARDIPPRGELGEFEPRIYYGEQSPSYSIVGAPEGEPPAEFDYLTGESDDAQQSNTYQGEGGVPMGSFFNRMLYTLKYREEKIFLSDAVNSESKILYHRNPRERVERVAPWLTLDGNAYPAVVGDQILWIIDGYTTTDGFPYASRTTLGEATATTLTTEQRRVIAPADQVNYIRNSVKVTVDAYDGTVTLYEWDTEDPVLSTWMKAFPGTVEPREEIGDELLAHLRYPEDLFKVQREVLSRYHITEPQEFYGGQDFWRIPDDPTGGVSGVNQPPYYLTLKMPGEESPTFSLTTTFVPTERPNLAAFMAVNAVPGEDYGEIRVIELPPNTTVPGPGTAQNNFSSNTVVANEVNILQRGDSEVVFGNLLTLPVGGGLLYVEPVYVRAAGGESFPLLRKVLVAFGENIAFENTLQEALDSVFGGEAGTATGETQQPPAEEEPAEPEEPSPPQTAQPNPELEQALNDAREALTASQEALQQQPPDWQAYGRAQEQLQAALERALQAGQQGGGSAGQQGTPTPTPSPTPGS